MLKKNNQKELLEFVNILLFESLLALQPDIFSDKDPKIKIGKNIVDIANKAKEILMKIPYIKAIFKKYAEQKLYEIANNKAIAQKYVKLLFEYIRNRETPRRLIDVLNQIQSYPLSEMRKDTIDEYETLVNELQRLIESMGHLTDVIKVLGIETNEIIQKLYTSNPATYEYATALAFSVITQLKLTTVEKNTNINYSQDDVMAGVYWYGKLKAGRPYTAPSGVPDIVIKLLTNELLIVESTLSTTASQWQREIEPSIRHAKHLGVMDIILVVPEIKQETIERIRTIGDPHRIAILDTKSIVKLMNLSTLVGFLPHSTILSPLFSEFFRRITFISCAKSYEKEINEIINYEVRKLIPLIVLRMLTTSKYSKRSEAVEDITERLSISLKELDVQLDENVHDVVLKTLSTLEKLGFIRRYNDTISYISFNELIVLATRTK